MSRKATGSQTLRIRGMFCPHCEETIQKALMSVPGVLSAEVSWEEERAVVCYDPEKADASVLETCIEEAGYEVASSGETKLQIASVLVLLLALTVIAHRLGLAQVFSFFPRAEASLGIGALFVTGLLTSVHCIAMCGGINLTQSVAAASGRRSILRANALYQCGRVLSYTLVGAAAGSIGRVLSFGGAMKGAVAVVAGLAMLVMALNMLGVFRILRKLRLPAALRPNLLKRAGGGSSFVIGLLNGLMPCGPLQAMQIYALSTGSAVRGALSMLSFSLGTVPLMLGFGLISGKLNRKYRRVMLTVSAMLIFVMGLNMAGNGLALCGVSMPQRSEGSVVTAMQEGDRQTLRTEIDYGSYPSVRVRAGVPVDWTIIVPEGKLNGCNGELRLPAYDLDIVLKEGENRVSFLPEEAGRFPYSCWMGMIQGTIEVTDE
ncbi:MAG: sulfite exporter TauE/SafE family protein [Candidatus Ventricola sp.]